MSSPIEETPLPVSARRTFAAGAPASGPRLVFFSGGSALRETSQTLTAYTRNSVHLVTPFDSGGSSAELRRRFDMPAVGDVRNRLLALADRSRPGFAEVGALFSYRISRTAGSAAATGELQTLARGEHPLTRRPSLPERSTLLRYLRAFESFAGPDFDLRGASIGNLILAAGYLESGRRMAPIVSICAELLGALGQVRLMLNANLHLKGVLHNGEEIIGQHLLTGKETPPLSQGIAELSLVDPALGNRSVRPRIGAGVNADIRDADLICYPIGSFFTSVIANLLPAGVGEAVSQARCRKVYVPNPLPDPESIDQSLAGQVRTLLRHLRADAPESIAPEDVLDAILIDPRANYAGSGDSVSELRNLGPQVISASLTRRDNGAIDPDLLCQALLALV